MVMVMVETERRREVLSQIHTISCCRTSELITPPVCPPLSSPRYSGLLGWGQFTGNTGDRDNVYIFHFSIQKTHWEKVRGRVNV